MGLKVLSEEQADHFVEKGWVKVESAFPLDAALKCQDFLWEKLEERGFLRNDPSTWTEPTVNLKNFNDSVFDACNTDRLVDAYEDIIGRGRFRGRDVRQNATWGNFIINFLPNVASGWHYDGDWFVHYLDTWHQGLLAVTYFSEVRPDGSATLIAEGSHKIVSKVLYNHPEGIQLRDAIRESRESHPWLKKLSAFRRNPEDPLATKAHHRKFMEPYHDPEGYTLRVVEAIGNPGDMYLCHPFLFHSGSDNLLRIPRFMCNRVTSLDENMNFNRENPEDYSLLELSIRRALGLKENEFCDWKRVSE